MAKLIVLLCLAAVLAVALAHRAHRVDRRSPSSLDGVGDRDQGRFRRPSERFFGERGGEGGVSRAWRRRQEFLRTKNGRRSHGVHRMGQPSPLQPSEQGVQGMSRQRMMDNLRADLERLQQMSHRGEVPDISSLRDAYRRIGGFHRLDRFGGEMGLAGRGLGQRNRADGYLNRDTWRRHRQSGRLHGMPIGFGDGPLGGLNRDNDMEPGIQGP